MQATSSEGLELLEQIEGPPVESNGHKRANEHDGDRATALWGGALLSAISESFAGLLREHYGRGPTQAKTYVNDDLIIVVMRGRGFTPLEQTIMDTGNPDHVAAMRSDFQLGMASRFNDTIKDLTGRTVVAYLPQAHVDPDVTIESFLLDGPLNHLAVVKTTDPE